jgi:hypothetical protein
MIYRGPGFLYDVHGSAPRPPPPVPLSVTKLDQRHTGRLRKRDNLLTGEGGRGAESYGRKKAWPSLYHLILSGCDGHLMRSSRSSKHEIYVFFGGGEGGIRIQYPNVIRIDNTKQQE